MVIKGRKTFLTENLSLLGSEVRIQRFSGEKGWEEYMVITRRAVDSLCWLLAKKIKKSGFLPDIVVALTRGGLFLSRPLADYLGDVQVVTIGIASGYGPDRQRQLPLITQPLPSLSKFEENLRVVEKLKPGQKIANVLVVDEVVDGGDTGKKAIEHIKEKWGFIKNLGNLKFACLVTKEKSLKSSTVDYYMLKTSSWVIFPWEICETIQKLYNRWKNYSTPLPDAKIKKRLKKLGFSGSDIEEFWPRKC